MPLTVTVPLLPGELPMLLPTFVTRPPPVMFIVAVPNKPTESELELVQVEPAPSTVTVPTPPTDSPIELNVLDTAPPF